MTSFKTPLPDQALAVVELRDLQIAANIGTYGPEDVIPEAHVLDLTLQLTRDLVWVQADDMALVFDYDPLIAQIDRIAQDQHYHTQEYLISRIVAVCAEYPQIQGIDICLRKHSVLGGTGSLGVRLSFGAGDLAAIRAPR